MPVRFRETELIPAPLVNITKSLDRKGTLKFATYTFTLTGAIVNIGTSKDSPGAQSYGSTMEDILAEQKRIRNLFDKESDGGRLEIETPDGGGPNTIDTYCIVRSINFDPSVWVNKCTYTIVLESTRIENDDEVNLGIEDYNEDWSVTENEDNTWSLSHRVDAKGTLVYGPGASQNDPVADAKRFVLDRRYVVNNDGTLTLPPSGDYLPSGFIVNFDVNDNYWNYSSIENIDPKNYIYSLTENFLYYPSGNAREIWSASFNIATESANKSDLNIDGTVIGHAGRLSHTDLRIANAKSHFENIIQPSLYTRLLQYAPSGYTLISTPTSRQISYEKSIGQLRYSYNFVAFSGNLITGAIEESIDVQDVGPTDVFAAIQIPGRSQGPVVQNMSTTTLPQRTVSISAIMAISSGIGLSNLNAMYLAKPNTNSIVNALKPNNSFYYLSGDQESWSPANRRYSRSVTWTIVSEGSGVSGLPSGIHYIP